MNDKWTTLAKLEAEAERLREQVEWDREALMFSEGQLADVERKISALHKLEQDKLRRWNQMVQP